LKLYSRRTRHIVRNPLHPAEGEIKQAERETSEIRDSAGEGLPGKDSDRRVREMYRLGNT
jgi:hypothetical protein